MVFAFLQRHMVNHCLRRRQRPHLAAGRAQDAASKAVRKEVAQASNPSLQAVDLRFPRITLI